MYKCGGVGTDYIIPTYVIIIMTLMSVALMTWYTNV